VAVKNKAFKRIRKHLDKLVAQWRVPLGLKWWTIKCRYFDDPERFEKENGWHALARTYADWRYMTASIEFNVPACEQQSERDLEDVVVHELCHILVNEMREGEIHHEERVCTRLAQAFQWTKQGY